MLAEVVRAFDGMDIETADANGTANVIYVDPQYWPLARDRNLCVIHVDLQRISGTGAMVTILAADSAGRIFTSIPLTGNTLTTKGAQIRVVVKDFSANLRIGVQITANAGQLGAAAFGLEYTLKSV